MWGKMKKPIHEHVLYIIYAYYYNTVIIYERVSAVNPASVRFYHIYIYILLGFCAYTHTWVTVFGTYSYSHAQFYMHIKIYI